MSELQFMPGQSGKEQRDPYELTSSPEYLNFQSMEVTEVDETKPWKPAKKVNVTKKTGEAVEIAANTPFFVFKNKDGKELTVSAEASGHIDVLHIKGTEAGSLFDEPSLEALMKDAAQRIPESVASEPGHSAFEMEMGKSMGKEGLASMEELVRDGVLTQEDVQKAMALKDEISKLNREGTKQDKESFIQTHGDGKVRFQLIRGDVLVPVVDAAKRPTTKLFMVFGPAEGDDRKTLYTAAPGRNMPRHPNPNQHKDKEGNLNEQTFNESADAWFKTVMLVG